VIFVLSLCHASEQSSKASAMVAVVLLFELGGDPKFMVGFAVELKHSCSQSCQGIPATTKWLDL